jgi:hypothetical protein
MKEKPTLNGGERLRRSNRREAMSAEEKNLTAKNLARRSRNQGDFK